MRTIQTVAVALALFVAANVGLSQTLPSSLALTETEVVGAQANGKFTDRIHGLNDDGQVWLAACCKICRKGKGPVRLFKKCDPA